MRTFRLLIPAAALSLLLLPSCGKKGGGPSYSMGTPAPVLESFDTGNFSSGVFVHTFNNEGTFRYHCSIHGSQSSGMNGDVVVTAGTPDSATVNISGLTFTPNVVTIHVGGYVKWIANGATHTVTRP